MISAPSALARQPAPRILMIRPRKIGDVVITTALIRSLRRAFPNAHLAYLTEPLCAQVLLKNPHVDALWDYPAGAGMAAHLRLARQLRRERFDVVIDWFSSPATARLAWLSGASVRIGYALRGRQWAYSHPRRTERAPGYVLFDQADLLVPLGVKLDSAALELYLTDQERAAAQAQLAAAGLQPGERLLAIAPAALSRDRAWPVRSYAAVADALAARAGLRTLLLGSAEEWPTLHAVRGCLKHAALPLLPTPSLRPAAALLASATLFLGADTGLRHLAMALGVPTVGVFGRAFPESWTPPQQPRHLAVAFDPGCKSACWYPHCPHLACSTRISPNQVLQACRRALAAAGAAPPTGQDATWHLAGG